MAEARFTFRVQPAFGITLADRMAATHFNVFARMSGADVIAMAKADRANVPCPGRCRPVMASGRASRSRPRPRSVRSWLRCVRFSCRVRRSSGRHRHPNELVRIQGNAHRSSEDLGWPYLWATSNRTVL